MPRPERVAVVVATHTNHPLLERCLTSIQPMLDQSEDLILVDNGSTEGTGRWAHERFPGITVVQLDHNRLFCGGYNAGIRMAIQEEYDFVLILNADAEVISPGFLDELLKAAQQWPRAAFVGPLVYWKSENVVQKTCLQFPSILRNMLIWLPWRIAKSRFETQPNAEAEVQFLNGVCVLCRISALREIGLMDEAFGGYVEDADWSWRAREKGWKSIFTPVASIIHYESNVGYEPYSLKTFLLKRNTVLWYLKIGWRISALSYASAAIGLACVRMISATSGDERKNHRYFVTGLWRAYVGLLLSRTRGEWFGPPFAAWIGNGIALNRS